MHEISIGNLKWSAKNANFPRLWGPSRGVNDISQYWDKGLAHSFSLLKARNHLLALKPLNNL